MIQRVIIDVEHRAPRVVRLQMPPDQHRSTLCDDIACRGELGRRRVVSGRLAARVRLDARATTSTQRLRVADARTGAVRDVLEETVADAVRVAATAASTGACCRRRTR